MHSKRVSLFLLAVATSSLAAAALSERPGELDQVPMSNVPTSDPIGKHVGSTSAANPEEFTMSHGSRLITEQEDCQTIVERVESHNGSFNVLPDTCVVWLEGSCEAGYCANWEGVVGAQGLNQTFQMAWRATASTGTSSADTGSGGCTWGTDSTGPEAMIGRIALGRGI
ncbi:hypothetical protein PG996_015674 [Apiospora saccharicola]|uniref:Ecp2 effector protein domain-containing protein n=1 Tax=Apiospora saccharicola TaxID=335842 RepID=A0ABR1TLU4_9PEZI